MRKLVINTTRYACQLLLLAQLWFISFNALALDPRNSGDGGVAIRKAQGLIRQLSQEKMQLASENGKLQQEKLSLNQKISQLEQTVKQLLVVQAQLAQYQIGFNEAKTRLVTEQTHLAEQRQQHQALIDKHNQTVNKANAIFADNQLLVHAIREREQWIQQCRQYNQELQTANGQLLQHYQDKGLLQQILESEPFTGIAQVKGQSLAEEYRFQLQQLSITPFQPANQQGDAPAVSKALEDKPAQAQP